MQMTTKTSKPGTSGRFIHTTKYCRGGNIGELEFSYADLVRVLGNPNGKTDGYKVSTSWTLQDTVTGETLEIYDWKMTKTYDARSGMTLQAFRELPSYSWHVGGRGDGVGHSSIVTALEGFIRAKLSVLNAEAAQLSLLASSLLKQG
jgi:hypothetical protein